MQIIDNNNYENSIIEREGCGVCLGNFDGVHIGHSSLLKLLTEKCAEKKIASAVYTFRTHPSEIICKRPVKLVMTGEQRVEAFADAGVDFVYLEDFTLEYASLSPQKFVEEILVSRLKAKLVVVGYDYTFGKMGRGTATYLESLGKKYGFEVFVVPQVSIEEKKVASTILRECVGTGKMKEFLKYANRPYSIWGVVVKGRRVGHELGFPTANILPEENLLLPPHGVYSTYTEIEGDPVKHHSVTNVGHNPTFHGDRPCTVETHIIDYDKELYGKKIKVCFLRQIRPEMKFSSPAALMEQMGQDIEVARKEVF